ncbi:MAG: hypothetical protein AAGD88_13410 [Bacteroidota bacterium]
MEPYRVTVLLDSIDAIEDILGSAMRFSARLDAKVEALYLKSPLAVVKQANQLSAKRNLYEDSRKARKTLKAKIEALQLDQAISTKVVYGNIKDTLHKYVMAEKPDLLVGSKSWFRQHGNLGAEAAWLVLSGANDFAVKEKLNLGIFENLPLDQKEDIASRILDTANKPLRYFKIRKTAAQKTDAKEKDVVEYVFTEGSNALESIAKYTDRVGIDVLCLSQTGRANNWFTSDAIGQLMRKTRVPVLLFKK